MLQVKGSDQPVRCRIHDYTLFYSDLNDLVKAVSYTHLSARWKWL